jgi:pimeloyl-ACP methyl ester carboxylesterase
MRTATHRLPGLVLTDHVFQLPLDYDDPAGERLTIFAREAVAPKRHADDLPWMVFFEGGPGFESPRPRSRDQSWLERALGDWRVLLLDQRGTGRSTPLNARTLAGRGPAESQAEYLRHFRADNIVRDAERIRRELLGDDVRWDVAGQSFGGFCITSYLSFAPDGVRNAYVMGGLPPLAASPEQVYRALYPRVLEKNRLYFERYPEDRARLAAVMELLHGSQVSLPGGDRLTPERLQCAGIVFGMHDGFERVHYLLEEAFFEDAERPILSDRFLYAAEAATGFYANPLYAALHEPIYCQGSASNWAAHRVRDEFPAFAPSSPEPLFTGEMIFPWMFEQHAALRPLQEAAELLARRSDWPALYDQAALGRCQARSAAAIYFDDMYVDATASVETARAIAGLRPWVTNRYQHDGGHEDGRRLFDRLVDLAIGEV